MQTLNNQLHLLGLKEGDQVICDSWIGRVYLNEFGLGVAIKSSHDPQAICDGSFPAFQGLRPWKVSRLERDSQDVISRAQERRAEPKTGEQAERPDPEDDPEYENEYCGDPD